MLWGKRKWEWNKGKTGDLKWSAQQNWYGFIGGAFRDASHVMRGIALIIKMISTQEIEILPYLVKFYLIVYSQRIGFPSA